MTSILDTALCLRESWHLYHVGVSLSLYAEWMLLTLEFFALTKDIPIRQSGLEFDGDDVEEATATLESERVWNVRQEQEGYLGADGDRFISPEGILIGIAFTPSMRSDEN